jgi:Holliday junction resolvase RusA-like endonuclease
MTFKPLDIDIYSPVVPYVRMTTQGKNFVPRARRYLGAQEDIKNLFDLAKRNLNCFDDYYVPEKCPFELVVNFYMNKLHYCDLDNLVKAILDAGQGILYKNDMHCDVIVAGRYLTEGEPHVQVKILPREETNDDTN